MSIPLKHYPFFGQTGTTEHDLNGVTAVEPGADGHSLLMLDHSGSVSVLDSNNTLTYKWKAYDVKCLSVKVSTVEPRLLATVGTDSSTTSNVIKVWLYQNGRADLLRWAPLTTPHPVISTVFTSHLILGLGSGEVIALRHIDQLVQSQLSGPGNNITTLGLGKSRTLYASADPVTNILFTGNALLITTPKSIVSLSFPGGHMPKSGTAPDILDAEAGVDIGCLALLADDRILACRDSSVVIYTSGEGDASGFTQGSGVEGDALNGPGTDAGPTANAQKPGLGRTLVQAADPTQLFHRTEPAPKAIAKTELVHFASMKVTLAVALPWRLLQGGESFAVSSIAETESESAPVKGMTGGHSPFGASTASGPSPYVALTLSPPRSSKSRLLIVDTLNSFIAFSASFDELLSFVWPTRSSLAVLSESGHLINVTENPLTHSLALLYARHQFELALGIARARRLPPREAADIFRRYGDFLYARGEFSRAMDCYVRTLGGLPTSYVVRRFLDPQRLPLLVRYLEALHEQGRASPDHTTLLLNCFTRLSDGAALNAFLQRSYDAGGASPPFDLATAVRVCRAGGYYAHAAWLSRRYGDHAAYLSVQLSDLNRPRAALAYLRGLCADDLAAGRASLAAHARQLLREVPDETRELLVEVCLGEVRIPAEEIGEAGVPGGIGPNEEAREATLEADGIIIPRTTRYDTGGQQRQGKTLDSAQSPVDAPSSSLATTAKKWTGLSYVLPEDEPAAPEATVQTLEARTAPQTFFAHFVDDPLSFVLFLEEVLKRVYKKEITRNGIRELASNESALSGGVGGNKEARESGVWEKTDYDSAERRISMDTEIITTAPEEEANTWNTLLEMYLTTEGGDGFEEKALVLLHADALVGYDPNQALLVCTTEGFAPGIVLIYERLGLYEEIIAYYIASGEEERVISALNAYGSEEQTEVYATVLKYLTSDKERYERHIGDIRDILDTISAEQLIPAIQVVDILGEYATMDVVIPFLTQQFNEAKENVAANQQQIAYFTAEVAEKRKEIAQLTDRTKPLVLQVSRCAGCGEALDLPCIHFMCKHSYHESCLTDENECPKCTPGHDAIRQIASNNANVTYEQFVEEIGYSSHPFETMVENFAKGFVI